MTRYLESEVIEHAIGARGRVRLRATTGSVMLRGADGDRAVVRIAYSIDAGDEEGAAAALREARVSVTRDEGRLEVDARDAEQGVRAALTRLASGRHVSTSFEVEVPSAAAVRVETVSGEIVVEGLDGEQRYATVSAPVEIERSAGPIAVKAVSGEISLEDCGDLRLEATSVSGDLLVQARRLLSTGISTVSGDVHLEAAFAADGEHRVETVSGDLRAHPLGGLSVELRGQAAELVEQLVGRRVGVVGGRRTVVAGDGGASLTFRSMSGRLELSTGHAGEREVRREPPRDAGGDEPVSQDRERYELDVLRSLERGEIDVTEAARRLEAAPHV